MGYGAAPNNAAAPADGAAAATPSAPAKPLTLEERVAQLETTLAVHTTQIAELERKAKRPGMFQMVMQYGAPFAVWYALLWGGSLLSIYVLLEAGIVSWQDTLRPLLESRGLEGYTDGISASTGNFLIAFIVNECVEPIRFPVVIATGVPVIKAFRRFMAGGRPAAGGAAAGAAGAGAAGAS